MNSNKHQEYQYLDLLKEALESGVRKVDRGTNIILYSLFGKQCHYDLSKEFPLLTTKKVYWKGVIHELYWFMSGQTNIKYLVDNNVHIWDDYPYKMYSAKCKVLASLRGRSGQSSKLKKQKGKTRAKSMEPPQAMP